MKRTSGILLHITSLPSPYGIGDIGPTAHRFVNILAKSQLSTWQFLPLTPTSSFIGNSPYSSPSAFAGNILLISPELLLSTGLATPEEVLRTHGPTEDFSAEALSITIVEQMRCSLLLAIFERLYPTLKTNPEYTEFCNTNAYWLTDYALFCVLKNQFNNANWTEWPTPLAHRNIVALQEFTAQHHKEIAAEQFMQFIFHQQWMTLKKHCTQLKITLLGDIPIYVTHDSADVWANPHIFQLDKHFQPTHVAGVPPDYFSETGQRWGNPLYNWDALKESNFDWWVKRIQHTLHLFHQIRLDHFRGFCGYWSIAAHEETAINGIWKKAPGLEFFQHLQNTLHTLPFVAEDLGIITDDVIELMHTFNLPCMRVLQFGFGQDLATVPHAPFNHPHNAVVYTGTHDNSTTKEWFENLDYDTKQIMEHYIGYSVTTDNCLATLIRLTLASTAQTAIVPMQDILKLGKEGRMNTPGIAKGNWEWRMKPTDLTETVFLEFQQECIFFGRTNQ